MTWFILWPLSLLFTALAMVLALFLPAFASANGWLPSWLSWFQTPDNSLDGDSGWQTEHWQWATELLPYPVARYVRRVGWLWRNPAYGFDIAVCGASLNFLDHVTFYGTKDTSDQGTPGWFFGRVGFTFWDLYIVWRYSQNYCFRFRAGWKLQAYAQNPVALLNNPVAQITLRVAPWASFTERRQ